MQLSDQLHAQDALPTVNNLGIHWMWGWMGYSAEIDVLEKELNFLPLPGFEPQVFQPVA